MATTDLFTHTAFLLHAVRDLPIRLELLRQLHSHATDPAGRERAANEALAEYSKRVARHSDAILVLTDDERAKALAGEFSDRVSTQLSIYLGTARNQAQLSENRSVLGVVVVAGAAGIGRAVERRNRERLMVLSGEIQKHFARDLDLNRHRATG